MKRLSLVFALAIALAGGVVPAAAEPPVSQLVHAPRVHVRDGTSSNWGGYAIETNLSSPASRAVSDVQGNWTVPAVTCSSNLNTYSAIWVGIDGYSDGTVEQLGTEQDCIGGHPSFSTWYEMYPRASHTVGLVVHARDSIRGEVKFVGNGQYVLSLKDITTGRSFSTTQTMRAKRTSAEWIVEPPSTSSGPLPLSKFGTVTLTNAKATLNGHTGTISDPAWRYDAITTASGGTTLMKPSALSAGGSSFTVQWFHN